MGTDHTSLVSEASTPSKDQALYVGFVDDS